MKMSEFEIIKMIQNVIPKNMQGVPGIGDDTAVLRVDSKTSYLFTTDVIVEGVDFIMGELSPDWVGRKALAVNISDIAAMGGEPQACVVSLGIPSRLSANWIRHFYSGLIRLAGNYKTACVGGDISRSKQFFASVALIGKAKPSEIILRQGAKDGDWIGVTGGLGGSILGHHYQFRPRVAEAQFLVHSCKPSSMIDISDGFLQDLDHLLARSKIGAQLFSEQIPVSPAALKLAKGNVSKAFEHALTDGEDFELLFTVSSERKKQLEKMWSRHFRKTPLSWVGRLRKSLRGVEWFQEGRKIRPPKLKKKGFSHF